MTNKDQDPFEDYFEKMSGTPEFYHVINLTSKGIVSRIDAMKFICKRFFIAGGEHGEGRPLERCMDTGTICDPPIRK